MLWVDEERYYGPDRRVANNFRLHDRRRENRADYKPSLDNAVRQLRLLVIDVRGVGKQSMFAERLRATALIAGASGKHRSADILNSLATQLERNSSDDFRPHIYEQLDRLYGTMAA
jgi:hypothetical protein